MYQAGWNSSAAIYQEPYNTDQMVNLAGSSPITVSEDPFVDSPFNVYADGRPGGLDLISQVDNYLTHHPLSSPCSGSSGDLAAYGASYDRCDVAMNYPL